MFPDNNIVEIYIDLNNAMCSFDPTLSVSIDYGWSPAESISDVSEVSGDLEPVDEPID